MTLEPRDDEGMSIMRWAEVKELARMFGILVVLVTAGWGLSARAQDAPGVVEVPDVPAVEAPAEPAAYVVAGSAAPAELAPALPVAVPAGV